MGYEKKYKDLVKAVKELQEANPSDKRIQNWVNENVPELAESEDERIVKNIISWLKKIDGQTIPINDYNAALAWLEKQKPDEWSKEDEYNLAFIQEALLGLDGDDSYREKCCKMADWLKSLKDRVGNFDDGYKVGFSAAKHNQWKPSDEQMEVLLTEVTAWTKGCPKQIVLESLYNDLKKLREE